MEHARATTLLASLADGELETEERAAVESHVQTCPACRDWLETYDLLASTLGDDADEHLSSEQAARFAVGPEHLTDVERKAIGEHLEGCSRCRREVDLTRSAVEHARRSERLVGIRRALVERPAVRWAAAAGFLLALAVGFSLREPRPDVQEGGRRLSAELLAESRVVESDDSITAEAIRVEGSADVTLRAGQSVVFGEGFAIGPETNLKVELARSPNGAAPEEGAPKGRRDLG